MRDNQKWKSLVLKDSLARHKTTKSVLVAMPYNSNLWGYAFWHPAKLVWHDGATMHVRHTDEFLFRLKNNETGDEIMLTAEEMRVAINGLNLAEQEEPLVHIPKPIEPENAVADESLIDYE